MPEKRRITKDPEERKNEIIDTAFGLFKENGYVETSINQIVKRIGVAQGTFYYHFKSKRDVLYEIIHRRFINDLKAAVRPIAEDPGLTALEKLKLIAEKEVSVSLERLPGIQKIRNGDLFRRIFSETVRNYVPLVTGVIEQGINEGVFDAPFPAQFCSVFHVSNFFFFHPGVFQWDEKEFENNIRAMIALMERGYGAPEGSFDFYYALLPQIRKNL